MTSQIPERPNIVFVCSDQHGFRYSGYAGHPLVQTPNLDRIARQGVNFANAYCGSPVCTPSRASMMTGAYPSDVGSFCNSTVWDGSRPTWGARLRNAGYDCRATGKMELDDDFDIGFLETDATHPHQHDPDITSLFRRPLCYRVGWREQVDGGTREERYPDEVQTGIAVDFITQEARRLRQPWAFYVGLLLPHPPFVALDRYHRLYPVGGVDTPEVSEKDLEELHPVYESLRQYAMTSTPIPEERIRRARAAYYGMLTELDEYVGRIWDALEATGQLDNTLFVYTSDHGESLGEHGLWFKNNLYEDAVHVPLLMAGPGVPQGLTVDRPVAHVDVAATLIELAGASHGAEIRGHSLAPLLERRASDHPGFVYSESHSEGNCTGSFMVRKGDWKYVSFTWYDDQLFNLAEDPSESRNLAEDPSAAGVLRELRDLLHAEVNPEAITRRAFDAQERVLRGLAAGKSEDELAGLLEGRLGPGQARALAARYVADE